MRRASVEEHIKRLRNSADVMEEQAKSDTSKKEYYTNLVQEYRAEANRLEMESKSEQNDTNSGSAS